MKKLLPTLIAVMSLVSQGWSQEVNTIEIDFHNKSFAECNGLQKVDDLREGDLFQLKIRNLNMNLYRVVIDKKDTIVSPGVSSFPTFDLVNLGSVGELLGQINLSTVSVTGSDTGSLRGDIDSVQSMIIKERSILLVEENRLKLYRDSIDALQLTIQKRILSYSVLDRSDQNYKFLWNKISIRDILEQTEQWKMNLRTLSVDLNKRQSEYLDFIADDKNVTKTINDNTNLKEADNNLRAAFIKSIVAADTLIESINSEKVASWIKELIYKKNSESFCYTSLPLQLKGDQTQLTIQIIPKKEEYDLQSYQTEIHLPIRKEFFTGIGMSFYYAGFKKNESYSIRSTILDNGNTNFEIVDEKNAKGELGITSLIHFGWRPFYDNRDKDDRIAINLVAGPALSLTNPIKPRIAVGGGLAYGRHNMLSMNVLYIGGYIKKKSELYNVNTGYMVEPENVTVSKLGGSCAISMGYIYKF